RGQGGPVTPIAVACPDAAATQELAGRLAGVLQPGDLILLEGDLGAGKTTFTQGMARALGVGDAVTSPTFVLMNIYPTDAGFDLVHVDVYRLDRLSEVVDLALPEMLEDGSVVVVEWGERAAAALGGEHLRVRIDAGDEGERTITLEPHGAGWERRLRALAVTA
ncbi:MAG TPA: tRNA (adenosine(37)-N6)-threonylcarbamoyltransferase complex ATPase subunit type 1 TsaE, partial [Acidimicrobiales bacterium]|nr:tRNA (adenosine(37)-N6)-threonylcarbamoyltransferase complex ATPase subunit type 1 TsaE [Acidimicrobiales bacterium]